MPLITKGMTVHSYTAGEAGLFVNSYLVETDAGVVVVDTNLLVSDISALRARMNAVGKPLRGVFVTHAHPDHFNGVFESAVSVHPAGLGHGVRPTACRWRRAVT